MVRDYYGWEDESTNIEEDVNNEENINNGENINMNEYDNIEENLNNDAMEEIEENISEELIQSLHRFPEMIKNDSGDYLYPEQYQNKLFIHKNKYIFINPNSFESISKPLMDRLLILLFEAHIGKIIEQSKNINASDDTQGISSEYIDNLIGNFNAAIDNHKEHIESQLEEYPTAEMYNQLNNKYNNLSKNMLDLSNEFARLATVKQSDTNNEKFEGLQHERLMAIQENNKDRISIGMLITLKEAGYSVEEIKELKLSKLI